MIRDLVKELRIFERNKVPEEIKILGVAIYFQTSFFRRTAKVLSELHKVSYKFEKVMLTCPKIKSSNHNCSSVINPIW